MNEHCVIAFAEALRGSGEILVSAFGDVPQVAAKLARATFEPDLVLTDGEARAIDADGNVESWFPFRFVFDLLSSGRRHVIMMPAQIDRHGNMNLSAVGDHAHPKVQLIGSRGAPGNTVNHATSYWVPNHTVRSFVPEVDFISGVGPPHGELRWIVTNLCAIDASMTVRSIHPGVTIDQIVENTGFELTIPAHVPVTRDATPEEMELIGALS